ncbi:MBL fold metallo-hydrolase [Neobacillus ginsengisoli]|uniref:Glyoxylase-like metal-dependent hydrolase (Beta-lactamase superfamily II) n=1 Tax=Neobacillus ginsengisoli TaxID=904295 RepID=A0ABT9XPF1_9BACI|nr:MBL fold metallo-hydrolase [Neobacillus ginsengisoli]MDQ0197308.1 glyoxylase-like metal-dependent hydrolase (beta-lactamase superfamily II) [Neobacillus ginsengisoli]
MKWSQIPLGVLQTNCYIIENTDQSCLIFDPGSEGKKLINWLTKRSLKPDAIFLTHAHFDHIGAVDEVRDKYKIPVYIHEEEETWLVDPKLNGSKFFTMQNLIQARPADFILKKEEAIKLGDFEFFVYETPGHSPGSVSYYFEKEGFVVSGDALFKSSIGRTDLPGGNQSQLLKSIHEKLLFLPEETEVLSGHGPITTIGEEMDSNPFLNGF